jgi:hypothetical protein
MQDTYVKRRTTSGVWTTPGVYLDPEFHPPRRVPFSTGVPAFLGVPNAKGNTDLKVPVEHEWHPPSFSRVFGRQSSQPPKGAQNCPYLVTVWSHFGQIFATPPQGHLPHAVRGFFQNGGQSCYVVPMLEHSQSALAGALRSLEALNTVDLVCAPDLMADSNLDQATKFRLQQQVMEHCEKMNDRFAILDSLQQDAGAAHNRKKGEDDPWAPVKTQWWELTGKNGALYYPWVKVRDAVHGTIAVPPCGHVAGIYARTDLQRGVHKSPANEILEGVVDLTDHLNNFDQGPLNEKGVNCLRRFPGRGIRVWGARTLSGHKEWRYVSVRRLFLTAIRWIEWYMPDVVFENNDAKLWGRIERELHTYFKDLFLRGALQGRTPQEAFYVKCDAETNPPELRDRGQVVTEIGLAPSNPLEFVVVRLIHGAAGVTIAGPDGPE